MKKDSNKESVKGKAVCRDEFPLMGEGGVLGEVGGVAIVKALVNLHHLSAEEAARLLGLKNKISYFYVCRAQDLTLSTLRDFCDGLGYDLLVRLHTNEGGDPDQFFEFEYQQERAKKGAQNLSFLWKMVKARGYNEPRLAEKLQTSLSVIYYYYRTDEIKIKMLHAFAKALEVNLTFVAAKRQGKAPGADGKNYVRNYIVMDEVIPLTNDNPKQD